MRYHPFMDGKALMRTFNWKNHNKIKEKEFDFLLKTGIEIIDETQEPWSEKNFGRPPYSPKPMVAVCLLKVYFGMPYRDIESLLRSNKTFQEILNLENIPDHNTIQRAMEKIPLEYLHHLNDKLAIKFKKNDRTLPSMQLDFPSGSSTSPGRK
jgi:transposase